MSPAKDPTLTDLTSSLAARTHPAATMARRGRGADVEAGAQLGAYRLLRRIGSGGMAEVFLAQKLGEEGFARTVAIKTILAHGAEEEAVRLFLDEARVAAALEHAAIVQTFDLGYENETLFIVMEYVAGPTLSRIVRELKKKHDRLMAPAMVAHIGARVASALDFAHRRATSHDGTALELVHRDISPQNILLTRNGLVKLSDFGVARASIQTHRTKTGQVRGKAAYMAPEQVRAKQLDGRTDIFALGLVLFEALTARRAFHRKGDIQSMRAVLSDPVPPVRTYNPECPPALDDAIMKCVEKDPAKRFQTAAELEQALARITQTLGASLIEHDIAEAIDEIFGEAEMYTSSDSGPAVEAWQPTIAAQAQGVRPMRIGGRLDPEVARMLETPPTASKSQATPPSRDGLDAPSSEPAALATDSLQSLETRPFLEHPSGTQPSVTGYTSAPLQTDSSVFPKKRLIRFGLPPLAALLGVVGMLGWHLVKAPTTVTEAPLAPEPPDDSSPAVVARPEPARARAASPTPAPTIKRAAPEASAPPAKRRRRSVTKAPPTIPTEPALKKPAPKPAPATTTKSFEGRLLQAAEAHKARGNIETATKLKRVLMNLSLGAEPSDADHALLRKAEASLR